MIKKRLYPKLLNQNNTHYLLHKVNNAYITTDNEVRIICENGYGDIINGGPYLMPDNSIAIIEKLSAKIKETSDIRKLIPDQTLSTLDKKGTGVKKLSDIRFVIAYHCGALPNGVISTLLKRDITKTT